MAISTMALTDKDLIETARRAKAMLAKLDLNPSGSSIMARRYLQLCRELNIRGLHIENKDGS